LAQTIEVTVIVAKPHPQKPKRATVFIVIRLDDSHIHDHYKNVQNFVFSFCVL